MPNPTHVDQVKKYLRYALNVAYAGEVDGVVRSAYDMVEDCLRQLREEHPTLPFVEQPPRNPGRSHGKLIKVKESDQWRRDGRVLTMELRKDSPLRARAVEALKVQGRKKLARELAAATTVREAAEILMRAARGKK